MRFCLNSDHFVNLLSIVMLRSRAVPTTLTTDDNPDTCRMSTRSVWNLEPSHNTWVLAGFSRSSLAVIQLACRLTCLYA